MRNITDMILRCASIIMAMIFLNACQTITLEDKPIIKKIEIDGELICIYQVKFVSGEDTCLDPQYYEEKIKPYEIIMPMETYEFFKKLALKACTYAGKDKANRCSHDVNTLDDTIKSILDIVKKYQKK